MKGYSATLIILYLKGVSFKYCIPLALIPNALDKIKKGLKK